MTPQRILVTGASGCVGHYITEALVQHTQHELFLLVRNPQKLQVDTQSRPGVTVIQGDMLHIEQLSELLPTLNTVVLTAAVWGGEGVYEVNIDKTLQLVQQLNPEVCQQIIYFSTASVLSPSLQLLPAAGEFGSDYIRSKFLCLEQISELPISDRLTTVFPTLVMGGDVNKPYSHISSGLPQTLRWSGLARFFKAQGKFHFIHAQDIATIILKLIEDPEMGIGKKLVLGTPAITFNQLIETCCTHNQQRVSPWQINLSPALMNLFIKLFRIQMTPWDYYCLNHLDFSFPEPVHPTRWQLPAYCPSLERLLQISTQQPT
jgi:nucleoside-diphosphate-sugar epimerase